jgi:hypothetical protein
MIRTDLLEEIYGNNNFNFYTKILDKSPELRFPVVTKEDGLNGFISRYFVRFANDLKSVVEVDETQYNTFSSNPRFMTIKIDWQIIGKKETTITSSGAKKLGVADINRNEVTVADLTFVSLHMYIKNYLEYWLYEE